MSEKIVPLPTETLKTSITLKTFKTPKTFSTQNLHIRKFCYTFACKIAHHELLTVNHIQL